MSRNRRLLAVLLIVWGIPLALTLGVGAWISYAGTIRVNVDERGPGGDHVKIKVPAAFVDLLLPFLPTVRCGSGDCNLKGNDVDRWMPVLRGLARDLESMEDGVLVQVKSSDENVLIAKKGRDMIVDSDCADESVHIVIPVRTVSAVLWKCGAIGGHPRLGAHGADSSGA